MENKTFMQNNFYLEISFAVVGSTFFESKVCFLDPLLLSDLEMLLSSGLFDLACLRFVVWRVVVLRFFIFRIVVRSCFGFVWRSADFDALCRFGLSLLLLELELPELEVELPELEVELPDLEVELSELELDRLELDGLEIRFSDLDLDRVRRVLIGWEDLEKFRFKLLINDSRISIKIHFFTNDIHFNVIAWLQKSQFISKLIINFVRWQSQTDFLCWPSNFNDKPYILTITF